MGQLSPGSLGIALGIALLGASYSCPADAAPQEKPQAAPAAPTAGAASPGKAPKKGKPKEVVPELPAAPATLHVGAPSPQGEWQLRIDNEGAEPLRIPADPRLLRFELWPARGPAKGKKPAQRIKKPVICDGLEAFGMQQSFPAERELVLEPGKSYVEQFDPRLICFGDKAKLLQGDALVRPLYGWPGKAGKKGEHELLAADATQLPRRYAPVRQLEAPSMLLSYAHPNPLAAAIDSPERLPPPGGVSSPDAVSGGASATPPAVTATRAPAAGDTPSSPSAGRAPAADASPAADDGSASPPPPHDDLGSRLTVSATRFADAQSQRDVVVTVKVRNAGERPGMLAPRNRQLSFTILGPDGPRSCPRTSMAHVVPPDMFQRVSEGKTVDMPVLLSELCPRGTFGRPGLYVAAPTFHADETDREQHVHALTGTASSTDPDPTAKEQKPQEEELTLVRVRQAPEAAYPAKPTVVPTSVLEQLAALAGMTVSYDDDGSSPAGAAGDSSSSAATDSAPPKAPAPSPPPPKAPPADAPHGK